MIDRDPGFETSRQIAAEQYALRAQRAQMQQPVRASDVPSQVNAPAQPANDVLGQVRVHRSIAEISRDGLIGSRRLGRNFEAMLREKPRVAEQQSPPENVDTAQQSPQPFLPSVLVSPGESAPLPLFDPNGRRNPRPIEDPNGTDVNLSPENRERALQQGLPASQTVRAATELFR